MNEDYYDIIKIVSQAMMLFVMLHILNKKEGPKYNSRRKGFHTGVMWTITYMIVGAIVIGIPLIKKQ